MRNHKVAITNVMGRGLEVPRRQTAAHLGRPEDDFNGGSFVCTHKRRSKHADRVTLLLLPTVLHPAKVTTPDCTTPRQTGTCEFDPL